MAQATKKKKFAALAEKLAKAANVTNVNATSMPRPRCKCQILSKLKCPCFKPTGVSSKNLQEVQLSEEECEALRLKDLENLSQSECAKQMGISQTTFHRILNKARKKLTDALINGKAINTTGR